MPDLMKKLESEVKNMKKTVNKAVDATGVKKVVDTVTKPLQEQYKKIEPTVKDLVKFRDDAKKKLYGDVEGRLRKVEARQAALESKVAALEAQLAAAKKHR